MFDVENTRKSTLCPLYISVGRSIALIKHIKRDQKLRTFSRKTKKWIYRLILARGRNKALPQKYIRHILFIDVHSRVLKYEIQMRYINEIYKCDIFSHDINHHYK